MGAPGSELSGTLRISAARQIGVAHLGAKCVPHVAHEGPRAKNDVRPKGTAETLFFRDIFAAVGRLLFLPLRKN